MVIKSRFDVAKPRADFQLALRRHNVLVFKDQKSMFCDVTDDLILSSRVQRLFEVDAPDNAS